MYVKECRPGDASGQAQGADLDAGAITDEVARLRDRIAQVEPRDLSDEDLLDIRRLRAALANLLGED